MTWPQDGQPRYVVDSCSGYRTMLRRGGGRRNLPGTSWLVLDRAICHRTVAEYRHERLNADGRLSRVQAIVLAERLALELAARLNAENAVG